MLTSLRRPRTFYKGLLALALPIILQNLITLSLSMTDTLFLGFLGENEISAVTLANAPFFVILLMIFGFQSGASVLISQYWGKKDLSTINRIVGLSLMIAFSITFVVSAVCWAFPRLITSFFTDDPLLIRLSADYMSYAAPAYLVNSVSQVYLGACRNMEDPKSGMYIMCIAMLANTGLNWIFIFGNLGAPRMGVQGAAFATFLSRVLELAITAIYAWRNKRFPLMPRLMFRPGKALLSDYMRYAAPVVLNETLWGLGTSLYPAIFGRMGADVLAAYTVAMNVERIFNVTSFGLSNSACVIVGKEIGAGQMTKAYDACDTLKVISFLAGALSGVLLFFCRWPISNFFEFPESTRAILRTVLMLYAVRLPINNLSNTLVVGILRAGGAVRYAMAVDIMPLWLFSLPLTTLFAFVFELPVLVVFLPIMVGETVKVLACLWKIRRRGWMHNLTRDIL